MVGIWKVGIVLLLYIYIGIRYLLRFVFFCVSDLEENNKVIDNIKSFMVSFIFIL